MSGWYDNVTEAFKRKEKVYYRMLLKLENIFVRKLHFSDENEDETSFRATTSSYKISCAYYGIYFTAMLYKSKSFVISFLIKTPFKENNFFTIVFFRNWFQKIYLF